MTEKKESILQAALELFASEGFAATSTSKVARKAGVSEGLIFRHFENKEGLLAAVIKEGEERARMLFADIVLETEPREVLRKTIHLASKMTSDPADAHFWKLQYKVKWETENYGEKKTEPLEMALTHAFSKLGYTNPAMEARTFLMMLDGLAMRYFLSEAFDLKSATDFLAQKYL